MDKVTLSQKAYEEIKKCLEQSKYDGYINGRQVARDLGMGYTPVREAFLRLQNEGLIRKEDNIGYFVNKVDIKELIRIFQVRECIEMFVWNQAFDKITDREINLMKALHQKEVTLFNAGEIQDFSKIDIQLHGVILKFYGNDDLNTLYFNVRQRHLLCPIETLKMGSKAALEEHAELIGYVEQRDKEAAVAMLQTHIRRTVMRMREGYVTFLE